MAYFLPGDLPLAGAHEPPQYACETKPSAVTSKELVQTQGSQGHSEGGMPFREETSQELLAATNQ